MDLLYRAYSSPMDLIGSYINRGRFGEFVKGFLQAEHDRKQAEADKDEEWHAWMAYVHSYSDKSYDDWKADLLGRAGSKKRRTGGDHDLDDKGIQSIMDSLFPSTEKE